MGALEGVGVFFSSHSCTFFFLMDTFVSSALFYGILHGMVYKVGLRLPERFSCGFFTEEMKWILHRGGNSCGHNEGIDCMDVGIPVWCR